MVTNEYNLFSVYGANDKRYYDGSILIAGFVNQHINTITMDKDWWEKTVYPKHQTWVDKYGIWNNKDTRTKLITADKNDARDDYEPYLAQTIEALRADPKVTQGQLRSLDIYKEPHSSHPTPTTEKYPVMSIEPSILKRVTVSFKPNGETTKGKPPGVSHVEVAWDDDLDVPPKKVTELKNIDIFTRSPFILGDFDEDQRGSAVYMAARYVMNADVSGYGPWSGISFAIIP